jgi:hypothetical protein
MKKIALLIVVLSIFWIQTNTSFAVNCDDNEKCVTIKVTEPIP